MPKKNEKGKRRKYKVMRKIGRRRNRDKEEDKARERKRERAFIEKREKKLRVVEREM